MKIGVRMRMIKGLWNERKEENWLSNRLNWLMEKMRRKFKERCMKKGLGLKSEMGIVEVRMKGRSNGIKDWGREGG